MTTGENILDDVQLTDLDHSDAAFTRAALIDEIDKAIAAAVQAEREQILAEADALEFKPGKWSDLLEFIRARSQEATK